MTDIVERLRREAKRFAAMDAAAERPWVADAAWAADNFSAAAEEIERLRAALLEAEMKAEIADIEDVGRLVAIGRREGIEAAARAAYHEALEARVAQRQYARDPRPYPGTVDEVVGNEAEMAERIEEAIRALLTEGGR